MRYTVRIMERYAKEVRVEAESEAEARSKAKALHETNEWDIVGEGEYIDAQYYTDNGEI